MVKKKRGCLGRIIKFFIVLLIILIVAIAVLWWATKPTEPDAFYTVPANMPVEPGSVIRVEPFTRQIPDNARAWRVLYSTTRFDGTIAPASAIVLAPRVPSGLPSDVVAWTHGTTGVAPPCGPSVMDQPFANVPALREAIAEGWVVVATDYIGLGTEGPHPYLIGEGEARSALDSLRALRQMKELAVTDKTVVWGHSQGGHAAMWTGILAPHYAPEQKLNGIAAAAPATDLSGLFSKVQATPVGRILSSYTITAYSSTYPDVGFDNYVRVGIRWLAHDMATRCMEGRKALFLVGQSMLAGGSIFSTDITAGSAGERLRSNIPYGPIAAPLWIAQGDSDQLVLPEIQDPFVEQLCAGGRSLEYATYAGRDHLSLVANDSPYAGDLIKWTKDRFENKPAPQGCAKTAE
jgi:alpha-beta hydrolase superfamily lysophospholipase